MCMYTCIHDVRHDIQIPCTRYVAINHFYDYRGEGAISLGQHAHDGRSQVWAQVAPQYGTSIIHAVAPVVSLSFFCYQDFESVKFLYVEHSHVSCVRSCA